MPGLLVGCTKGASLSALRAVLLMEVATQQMLMALPPVAPAAMSSAMLQLGFLADGVHLVSTEARVTLALPWHAALDCCRECSGKLGLAVPTSSLMCRLHGGQAAWPLTT